MSAGDVAALIRSRVRDVADYPKPGIVFKDITPLLADPVAFAAVVQAVSARHPEAAKVVGIEARGFILGAPVAYALRAGFIPVRKEGKLPATTFSESYALEYGEAVVELHDDVLAAGDRVLVVDDVLATGGTLAATVALIRRSGAEVAGVSVLLEIPGLGGRERVAALGVDVHVLAAGRGGGGG